MQRSNMPGYPLKFEVDKLEMHKFVEPDDHTAMDDEKVLWKVVC